jgi:hypothetical protein
VSRLGALLALHGLGLDRWEELVLASSTHFRPRRRTLAGEGGEAASGSGLEAAGGRGGPC